LRFELLKLLVVDDNHHMRVLLIEVLRAIGVRDIFEAGDGAEALTFLRNRQVDIVMTDLSMQPLDGIDLTKLIRNADDSPAPMIPIIMITGHTTQRRVAQARDAGVTEFLAKPVTAQGVIRRINMVVNHPRPFIRSGDYFGPDRRRQKSDNWPGPHRRADDKKTTSIDT
jgi:two-component system chemotaxis response regulator CheY